MNRNHIDNGADFNVDAQLDRVVNEIAARNFPSRSSMNTYIGFQLRCGRLTRELRAYISIYRKRFDCYPDDDHLMTVGECIYPIFEKRGDWKSLASPRQEILVVKEMRLDQLQQLAGRAAPNRPLSGPLSANSS